MARFRVATSAEVPEGKAILVDAGEQRLLLCNVDGSYCAIDDICTHDGGPLGEGQLYGDEIECPRHGARFNVCSGKATRMPAVRAVRSHPVEVKNGELYVELEDDW